MRKDLILKSNDERKEIVLIPEYKNELIEVINNEINTLIELQNKLNENDKNVIGFDAVKDTVLKTEYFLFKLKCTF
jgi:hypothetical protein